MMHDENDKELFQRPQLNKKKGQTLCLEAYGFFQRGVRRSRSLRRLPNYSETIHFLLNYQRQLWFSSQVKEGY